MQKIIYLDQNYLSNMAKACNGLIDNSEETEYWESIFQILINAVFNNKVACLK
ncbi:hypothetical protein ACFLYB_06665 [Chloroflexota bacterium]